MLFKAGKIIFAAVSFPVCVKKDLTVIMASLTREKTVFPEDHQIKSLALRNESFYLTFGMNEVKFIWSSKKFIIVAETHSPRKYF